MNWSPDILKPTTKTVVVIPAYNEVSTIREVIQSLVRLSFFVVIVDDHSTPTLYPLIKDLPVCYLYHRVNLGQGAALQTGISYARTLDPEVIVTFDADGQHQVQDIPTLIAPVFNGEADIVLGSRFLPESTLRVDLSRKLILQAARFINLFFSGLLLTDAHNGLRALGRKAYEKITIHENRMAHASEILFEIKKHHLVFKEVPVHIHYTSYSREKGQSWTDSIKVLFDLILHKLFR